MPEWFEDEAFWREMYSYLFSEERVSRAEEEIDKIFALTGFQGNTVLDLCCGPGRHSVVLAKKGLQVTAVDRTSFFLEKAKEQARAENVEIEWVLEDMRNFVRPNTYDLILNMFTSFGYFDDKQDDVKVLNHIYQSLKSGGACLLEMMSKEILARKFQSTISQKLLDGSLIVQRHEVFDEWSRIRNEWLLIRDGKAASFTFHHTIYSGQELKDRLLQAGFAQVKLFGNLDGEEYGLNASRLVVVGRKSSES
jgi:SAM-dependent methyltransferase